MLLVKSRPIPLPVFKGGRGWYDDFAVTGASDPGYTLSAGAKDRLSDGIRLRATTTTTAYHSLPTWFKAPNFAAETVTRLVAGSTQVVLEFRYLNSNNRWRLALTSGNELQLIKTVSSTGTIVGTLSGVTATSYQRIGIRAVGPLIEVYLNGVKVLSTSDTDNISNALFGFWCYDAVIGTVQADWQYLAIRPDTDAKHWQVIEERETDPCEEIP